MTTVSVPNLVIKQQRIKFTDFFLIVWKLLIPFRISGWSAIV